MIDIKKYRQEFPYLDSETVYFDHAAVTPLCNRVRIYMDKYIRQAQGEKIENWFDTMEMAQAAREKFSRLINSPDHRVAMVKNTTDGMILLARGLKWEEGDRIILHRMEFPSNVYPWWDLQPFGVKLDFLDSDLGVVTTADLHKVVTKRTRLVAVSWVQYFSGYRNNIRALADWCHERDILLAVDVMQGLGAIQFDISEQRPDFIATGTAKWLCGLQGVGFIYLTQELQDMLHPPHMGWQGRSDLLDFHNYSQPLKPDASRYEFSTPNSVGVWGVNGSLDLLLDAGPEAIEQRILELSDYLYRKLIEQNYRIISDRHADAKSGIIVVSHQRSEYNQRVFERLQSRDFHISYRNGNLRVSPHFYNTKAEIDSFISAMANL